MANLIESKDLIHWVPGRVLSESDHLSCDGVTQRSFRYQGQDVEIPPMKDFMVVSYTGGATKMQRAFDGTWKKTECEPGDCSLLTRSQISHWYWTQPIDVNHIYLTDALMSRVARDIFDRNIEDIRLRDVLRTQDPVMSSISTAINQETKQAAVGGALYVESLATQLAVHLLRNYSDFKIATRNDKASLSKNQIDLIAEYVDAHLADNICLKELASLVGLGQYSFCRYFKERVGLSPYAYVIECRLVKARELIKDGQHPLKAIAGMCGFSDQAHLTRAFKIRFRVTPSSFKHKY